MSLNQRIILPLFAAGALALCAPVSAEEVIATVNDGKITQEDYRRFVIEATQGVQGNPQLNPQDVITELLSRELLYQDAIKHKLDKRKDVIEELARFQYKLLVGTALNEALKKNPITDKELQEIYDKDIKNLKPKEYKARHILVGEKTQAEQITTELDLGGNFAKLAEKHSIDTKSKVKGGDIGWFKPNANLPEFSRSVMQLEKGKYTKVPVQSPVGWHIIKLDDTRDVAPPTFEQVKPKLSQVVKQERVIQYIQSLKEKAEIKINQPK